MKIRNRAISVARESVLGRPENIEIEWGRSKGSADCVAKNGEKRVPLFFSLGCTRMEQKKLSVVLAVKQTFDKNGTLLGKMLDFYSFLLHWFQLYC